MLPLLASMFCQPTLKLVPMSPAPSLMRNTKPSQAGPAAAHAAFTAQIPPSIVSP